MRILFSFILVSTFAFGQSTSQPEKESNSDLRSGLIVFAVEDKNEETTTWLERSSNLDYFLKQSKEEEITKIQKITTKVALELDKKFSAAFLKIQYELPASPEECKASLHLVMKGDVQKICPKEEKKTQEIEAFLKDVQTKF